MNKNCSISNAHSFLLHPISNIRNGSPKFFYILPHKNKRNKPFFETFSFVLDQQSDKRYSQLLETPSWMSAKKRSPNLIPFRHTCHRFESKSSRITWSNIKRLLPIRLLAKFFLLTRSIRSFFRSREYRSAKLKLREGEEEGEERKKETCRHRRFVLADCQSGRPQLSRFEFELVYANLSFLGRKSNFFFRL